MSAQLAFSATHVSGTDSNVIVPAGSIVTEYDVRVRVDSFELAVVSVAVDRSVSAGVDPDPD
jgi:hypothetical protein